MTRQAGPDGIGDGERLPWLEPYREPSAKLAAVRSRSSKPRPSRAPRAALWTVATLALLAAVGGGGYWLGQRTGSVPSAVDGRPSQDIVAEAPAGPFAPPPDQPIEPPVPPAVEAPPAPVVEPTRPTGTRADARRPSAKAKTRPSAARRRQQDSVTAKQREAVRTWPKMPSPGPAGQVIQLGAFSTRARAEAAYRQRVARYPLLAGMPQVVVPVITKPRGQVLYVLRLGTSSRQQSQIVCRNLEQSGDHCLVIG